MMPKKTPDEIKKGLDNPIRVHFHINDIEPRLKPLDLHDLEFLHADALAYIQQLEEDNAKKHEKIMQLYIALENMQGIVQSITKDSKTTFQQLVTERDEAYEAICDHCMDIPCQENECYWYRKMNQTEETKP